MLAVGGPNALGRRRVTYDLGQMGKRANGRLGTGKSRDKRQGAKDTESRWIEERREWL